MACISHTNLFRFWCNYENALGQKSNLRASLCVRYGEGVTMEQPADPTFPSAPPPPREKRLKSKGISEICTSTRNKQLKVKKKKKKTKKHKQKCSIKGTCGFPSCPSTEHAHLTPPNKQLCSSVNAWAPMLKALYCQQSCTTQLLRFKM